MVICCPARFIAVCEVSAKCFLKKWQDNEVMTMWVGGVLIVGNIASGLPNQQDIEKQDGGCLL